MFRNTDEIGLTNYFKIAQELRKMAALSWPGRSQRLMRLFAQLSAHRSNFSDKIDSTESDHLTFINFFYNI